MLVTFPNITGFRYGCETFPNITGFRAPVADGMLPGRR